MSTNKRNSLMEFLHNTIDDFRHQASCYRKLADPKREIKTTNKLSIKVC